MTSFASPGLGLGFAFQWFVKQVEPRGLGLCLRIAVFLVFAQGIAQAQQITDTYSGGYAMGQTQLPGGQTTDTYESILRKEAQTVQFEENKGQWPSDILYRHTSGQASYQFLKNGVSIGILEPGKKNSKPERDEKGRLKDRTETTQEETTRNGLVWNLEFVGANNDPNVVGEKKRLHTINYMKPGLHLTGVANYGEVWYEDIYEKTDVRFYGKDGASLMEYDFVVRPGGDYRNIRLRMAGVDGLCLSEEGELLFQTPFGEMKKGKPYTYQVIDGEEREVPSSYVIHENNEISFHLDGPLDASEPLVIDPTVLEWSAYVGASFTTRVIGLQVNSMGEVYASGYVANNGFPVTPGAFQVTKNGGSDIFVSKISADGSTLLASTFIGGSAGDGGGNISLDQNGNVYLVSSSFSSDFPITAGAFQTTRKGDRDLVIAKLNPSLSTLLFGTYLGGAQGYDRFEEIFVSPTGELIIVGLTSSTDFPVTAGAYQTVHSGGNDITISKLNTTGTSLVYSTFLGSPTSESRLKAKLNSLGEVVMTGSTGPNYPLTPDAFDNIQSGGEMFYSRLSADGSTLLYSTYLGGSYYDERPVIAVDANDNVFIGLTTYSFDYPVTLGAYQSDYNEYGGGGSVAITAFSPTNDVIYSTYFGTQNTDLIYAMAANDAGELVFGGESAADYGFPLVNPIHGNKHNGYEGYVAKLNASGTDLIFSTFYSYALWANWDRSNSLKLAPNGDIYITGYSDFNLQVTPDAVVPSNSGYAPYFIAKLSPAGDLIYGTYIRSETNTMVVNQEGDLFVAGEYRGGSSYSGLTTEGAFNATTESQAMVYKISSCAPASNNTISPATQTVCIQGTPDTLVGTTASLLLPNLIYQDVVFPYPDINESSYQWQSSLDGTTGWTDVPNGEEKDYQPPSLTEAHYFRRIVSAGCDGADTSNVIEILVNTDIAPSVDSGHDSLSICPGGSIVLGGSPTATGGSGGYMYEWTPVIALDDPTIANPTSTPPEGAIYTIKVTDALGCVKKEQVTVTIVEANAGPDQTYCSGAPGALLGTLPPPNISGFSYSWQNVLGGTAGLNNPNIPQPIATPSVTTSYELTISGPSGCPEKDTVTVTIVPAPVADAGPDQSLCTNSIATLGTPSTSGESYTWTSPYSSWLNNRNSAEPTFHANAVPADFNPVPFYLHVSAGGCYNIDTVWIQIDTLPTVDLINNRCSSPVQLTYAVPPPSGLIYTWSTNPPAPLASTLLSDTTAQSPTATVSEQVIFNLTVTNSMGCISHDHVTVSPSCQETCELPAFLPNKATVCSSLDSVSLYPVSEYPGHSYSWRTLANTTEGILSDPDQAFIFVRPTVNTTYVLTATLIEDPSQSCSNSVDVFVLPAPTVDAGNDTTVCALSPVQLGDVPIPGFGYVWTPDDDLDNPYLANPTATVTSSRVYQVTMTVDTTGCHAKDIVRVTMKNPFADAGPDGEFCEGAVAVMGSQGLPHHTYDWSPGIGLSDSTAAMPSIVLFSSNAFELVATDTLTGCSIRDTVVFTEGHPPGADAGQVAHIICPGGGVALGTTDSTAFGYTYQWSPIEGLDNPTSPTPIASPTQTTSYTLYVSKNNSFGCEAIDVTTVNVIAGPSCPSVDAGPDVEVCLGESAVIGTAVTSGFTYQWSPANGLDNPTAAMPTATPTATTIYYLLATETATGYSALDSVTVTVNGFPTVVDAGPDLSDECYGSTELIGTEAIAGYSYSWSPTTGLSDPNSAQPTLTLTADATYILTVTTASGCSATDTLNVTVKPNEADAGPDQTFCAGTVTIGTPAVAGRSYYWYTSNGYVGNGAQLSVSPNEPTQYWVRVIYSGCSTYDTVMVTPDATVDVGTPSPRTICLGETTQLGADPLPGYTYSWAADPSLSATNIANPMATPTANTTYTLTATNTANGCARTASITVDVSVPSTDGGSDKTVCDGANVQIGTPPVNDYAYSWSPATGLDNPLSSQPWVQSVSQNQTYILTATNTNMGCQIKDTVNVFVSSEVAPVADAGPDTYFCAFSSGVVIGTPVVSGLSYSWAPTTGLSDPNIAQPTVTEAAFSGNNFLGGTASFVLTVYDPSTGCSSLDDVTVSYFELEADAGADQTICAGGSTRLLISSYEAYAGTTYQVDFTPSDGITYYDWDYYADPAQTTHYLMTITHLHSGCSASDGFTVTVNPDAAPAVDTGEDVFLCEGDTAQLGGPAQTGLTYAWKPTHSYYGLSSTTISNPTAYPPGNGRTYTLTVTDTTSGCSNTGEVTVTRVTAPVADAGPNQIICEGDVTGVQIGTPAVAGLEYLWIPSTGLDNPNIAQPTAQPSSTTEYTLIVTNPIGNANCSVNSTVTVTVGAAPSTLLEASAGQDTIIAPGDDVQLGPVNNIPGYTYSWSPSTYLTSTTITNPIATPTMATMYTVTVTNTATGCTATDNVFVGLLRGRDYGDLPDGTVGIGTGDYQTLSANFGACHVISPDLKIGEEVDSEADGQPSALANGDSADFDDEDGIASFPVFMPGSPADVTVSVSNTTGSIATLYGFIDWNNDGDFIDADESTIVAVPDGTTGDVILNFSVPITAVTGTDLGARFRLSTQIGLSANYCAVNGEVEDYLVQVVNCALTATASNDGPLNCNKSNATLTALPATGVTYVWSTGGTSQTEVVSAPGIYSVTITETTTGCVSIDTTRVTEATNPEVITSLNDIVCEGDVINLNADAKGGASPYSFSWSGPNGFTSNSQNPSIANATLAMNGSYNVTLTDAYGCTSTGLIVVTVQAPSPPIEICPGQTYTQSVPVTITNVQWFRNGTLVATGSSYDVTTIGVYTFAGVDSDGCPIASCCPITFVPGPCPEICDDGIDNDGDGLVDCADPECGNFINISTNATATPICVGDNTTISASASGGSGSYTYNWDNGLGIGISHNISPLSTTTYTVTATDSDGCANTAQITITVNFCAEDCTDGFDNDGDGLIDCDDPDCGLSLTATPLDASCGNNDGQVTITASGGSGSYEYSDDNSTWQASNIFTNLASGTYTFYVRNDEGSCPTSVNATVTDICEDCTDGIDNDGDGLIDCNDPDCPPITSIGPDITICSGANTPLTAAASGGTAPYTFSWDNGLGNGANKVVSPAATTVYTVTVTSAASCTSTAQVTVTVTVCTEDCTDGIDNDADGLIDCDDPDCQAVGMPTAVDDVFNTCPGIAYNGLVSLNDGNFQNPIYTIVTPTTQGSLTINNFGAFTYTPSNSNCGTDQFTYQVCNQVTGCCATALADIIIGDNIPPTLQNVPADITISCDDEIPLPPLVFGEDACPGIYIDFDETSTEGNLGTCGNYTITRTWTTTDLCGNTGSQSQQITVIDNTKPEIFRVYTLPNGKKLVAGVAQSTSQRWKYVKFPIHFDNPPLVFVQVISDNDIAPVVVQTRYLSTTGFEMRLQEEEAADNVHGGESVAWMAIEPGTFDSGTKLAAGLLTGVNHNSQTLNYPLTFPANPVFIAGLQGATEYDPASIRTQSATGNSIQLSLQEEQSDDSETTHANENVAYLAFTASTTLYDEDGMLVGESGTVNAGHNWVTVNLGNSYSKPVVIFGGLASTEADAANIRVRNVTQNSFEVQVQEWDYLDGNHLVETLGYMVFEGGIPQEDNFFCSTDADQLQPGVNLIAIDNCDGQVAFGYTETESLLPSGLQTVRSWIAIDDCGNVNLQTKYDTCRVAAVRLKTVLDGAMLANDGSGLMRDDLRSKYFVPTEEPYTDLPYFAHKGRGGDEVINSQSMLHITGTQAVADWLFVECRDLSVDSLVLSTSSVLLLRDGSVIAPDGGDVIYFWDLPEGNYHIAVRHRNHLGVMTDHDWYLCSDNPPLIDLSKTETAVRGYDFAANELGGVRKMWAGDFNSDGRVIYQGPYNDVFFLFSRVLSDYENINHLANFIVYGYNQEDFNLDGRSIYQGPGNDRAMILYHTVLSHPGNLGFLANYVVYQILP